jgi:hypothetical protein
VYDRRTISVIVSLFAAQWARLTAAHNNLNSALSVRLELEKEKLLLPTVVLFCFQEENGDAPPFWAGALKLTVLPSQRPISMLRQAESSLTTSSILSSVTIDFNIAAFQYGVLYEKYEMVNTDTYIDGLIIRLKIKDENEVHQFIYADEYLPVLS